MLIIKRTLIENTFISIYNSYLIILKVVYLLLIVISPQIITVARILTVTDIQKINLIN